MLRGRSGLVVPFHATRRKLIADRGVTSWHPLVATHRSLRPLLGASSSLSNRMIVASNSLPEANRSRRPEPRCSMRPAKMPLSGVVSWLIWITNAFQLGSSGSMTSGSLPAGFVDFMAQAQCAEPVHQVLRDF
jgi:hypothetical protein